MSSDATTVWDLLDMLEQHNPRVPLLWPVRVQVVHQLDGDKVAVTAVILHDQPQPRIVPEA